MMSSIPAETRFEEIFDFLTSTPTPEQIIAFQPSAVLQQRLGELLNKNRSGCLTQEEQEELKRFLWINHFMNLLKIKARQPSRHCHR